MIEKNLSVHFLWGKEGITEKFDWRFGFEIYFPTIRDINATFNCYDTAHAPHEPEATLRLQSSEEKTIFINIPQDFCRSHMRGFGNI